LEPLGILSHVIIKDIEQVFLSGFHVYSDLAEGSYDLGGGGLSRPDITRHHQGPGLLLQQELELIRFRPDQLQGFIMVNRCYLRNNPRDAFFEFILYSFSCFVIHDCSPCNVG
jgi:hypothetical protein